MNSWIKSCKYSIYVLLKKVHTPHWGCFWCFVLIFVLFSVCFLRKSLSLDSLGTNANINYHINYEKSFPLCSEYKVHTPHNTFKKSNFFWCSSRDCFSLYSLIANSHFMFIMSVYQISCSKSGSHTSQCSSVGHTHQVLMIIISWILLKSQVHTLH